MLITKYAPETLFIPVILFIAGYKKSSVISLLILLFIFRKGVVYFEKNKDEIISPAEGIVDNIKTEKGKTTASIFLNPLNRHFQISPVSGIVKTVNYIPGEFDMAYNEISTKNERVETVIYTKHFGDIKVVQIAGYIFRRIVNKAQENKIIKKGDFLGLIKFSSKVEISFPSEFIFNKRIGDKIELGETIISKKTLQ